MDSMRSLNTSLPGTSPQRQPASEPPEALLSAFKAAALSVTKLYKTAAVDQTRARAEGYQDALDELLGFLDKEDIGLTDGEGWRIRRWATERLDGQNSVPPNVESDDESTNNSAERAVSPVLQRSQSTTRLPPPTPRPTRTESVQTEPVSSTHQAPIEEEAMLPTLSTIPQTNFTFRSSHVYPPDSDTILTDIDLSDASRTQVQDASTTPHVTRPSRPTPRHNNQSRLNSRGSANSRLAGQKRKINFGEFFDIGNLGHGGGKDGGGKRGRFA